MHRLFRYYNQNRKKIWKIMIIIACIIILVQLLNQIAIQKSIQEQELIEEQEKIEAEKKKNNNYEPYESESEAIISSQDDVPDRYKEEFGNIIEEFYTYCINHEPQKAYNMLSTEIKNNQYQTQELFETLYYKSKFEGDKTYSFKAYYTSKRKYIYQVKIYDNMLSTGSKNTTYIEDYVTIVPEDDKYKLNINKYISKEKINKSNSNELLSVNIDFVDTYLDYQIYTFTIKNNTENTILIDTKEKSKTLFLTTGNNNKFDSYLYENNEKDFIFEPYQSKTIKIKFNNKYRTDVTIQSITFSDIVNYNEYLENKNIERKSIVIEI